MANFITLEESIPQLLSGAVGIIPTDTIYGISASITYQNAIERIYHLKQRNPAKPMVILIAGLGDLAQFDIQPTPDMTEFINKYWPGPVSIVLPCPSSDLTYLHRGQQSLAFRLPDSEKFRDFLRQTGPIVATSANIEGQPHAISIDQAEEYFGDTVDFYVDGGEMDAQPSTIFRYDESSPETIR